MRVADQLWTLYRLGAQLWQDGRGPVLVAVAAGWFLSLGVRMIYPAILPQLRDAYELDLTTAGLLITVLWVAYALGQLPGGILDDQFGDKRVLVASTGVSALALSLVVTARSTSVLFGATILFGSATALYGVARFTILSTNYPDRDGTAIGLTMAAGDLGSSLLPPLAGVLSVTITWEFGFGFAIPLFLVAATGIYVAVPSDGHSSKVERSKPNNTLNTIYKIIYIMRSRSILLVTAIQTLGYCIWQGFTGFYPTYLVEVKGLSPTAATILFGAFFALGILIKPIVGSAYDTYGLRQSLPIVLFLITVSMILIPLVDSLLSIAVITALASSVLGYGTITLTYLTNSFPDSIQGTGLGFLRTAYMLAGAGTPTVMGVLADAGYFSEAFFLLAGVGAVALLLSMYVSKQ